MDRIPIKTNPKLFDKAVLPMQRALADLAWLDYSFGICESLVDVVDGKKYTSANLYLGDGKYERIEPCEELGNFSFFYLKDPQSFGIKDSSLLKSPYSLILWYDLTKVSLPTDERNREAVKAQIMDALDSLHSPYFTIDKIYENPRNVFSDFSYDHTNNQFLMQPFTGIRIDGTLTARTECLHRRTDDGDSYSYSFTKSFDL